ncbi:MAG: hypothetical protein BGO29_11915 [Bacteroidales bacterium 36-12]|nr:MAG: hypothetical protein BGO29_11915 [Bacteroidales bacterium 36-12]
MIRLNTYKMIRKSCILYLLLSILLLNSCYSYRNVGLLQEGNKDLPTYQSEPYEDYRIKINDELLIRLITLDQDMSKLIIGSEGGASSQNALSYRVYTDGTVDFPFIKNIHVADLTIAEASMVIENRFKEIIPDAEIKLTLANKSFTVIGEAGAGVFPIIKDRMTLFQALSMSGEIKNTGDFAKVKIIRETSEGVKTLDFDIRPISIINSKYYYIYPNDIIYVRKSPSSFYDIDNYSSFISLISTSLSLLFMVIYYFK